MEIEQNSQNEIVKDAKPLLFNVGFSNYLDYLSPKVLPFTSIGAIIGGSRGYIIGDLAALYFYSHGSMFGAMGVSFYSTIYGLRYVRQQNDLTNYAISGTITGGMTSVALSGVRGIPFGFIFGAIFGSAYFTAGNYLYDSAKNGWLLSRKNALTDSNKTRFLNRDIDKRMLRQLPTDEER